MASIGIFTGGMPGTSIMSDLLTAIAQSTYNTVVLWSAHVDSAGNIGLNGVPIVANGVFDSNQQNWANAVTALKTNPGTTINRIELSLGSGAQDDTTFANIKALIQKYPEMETNPVYLNLVALQKALTLDAIDYDDENEYDLNSSRILAGWCVSLGMKVTVCPYTNAGYWGSLITAINSENGENAVDAIYLQSYQDLDNDPAQWNAQLEAEGVPIFVSAGSWATHYETGTTTCTTSTTATEVEQLLKNWRTRTYLAGGWMYCGTDMLNCPGGGTAADYATAITNGLA